MRWLDKAALEPLSKEFCEVKSLLKNEDPEDNPYKSKYEARKILENIKLEVGVVLNCLMVFFQNLQLSRQFITFTD